MSKEGDAGQVREGFSHGGEVIGGSTAGSPVLTCQESSPLVLESRCSRMVKCVYAAGENAERKMRCV